MILPAADAAPGRSRQRGARPSRAYSPPACEHSRPARAVVAEPTVAGGLRADRSRGTGSGAASDPRTLRRASRRDSRGCGSRPSRPPPSRGPAAGSGGRGRSAAERARGLRGGGCWGPGAARGPRRAGRSDDRPRPPARVERTEAVAPAAGTAAAGMPGDGAERHRPGVDDRPRAAAIISTELRLRNVAAERGAGDQVDTGGGECRPIRRRRVRPPASVVQPSSWARPHACCTTSSAAASVPTWPLSSGASAISRRGSRPR